MEMEDMMSDVNRIKMVLEYSGLNNTQFCAKTGMPAATLTGIMTQRSKPSLQILRKIDDAFPEIDTLWIYTGQGNMLGGIAANTQEGDTVGQSRPPVSQADQEPMIFDFAELDAPSASSETAPASASRPQENNPSHASTSGSVRTLAPSASNTVSQSRNVHSSEITMSQQDIEKVALGVVSKLQKPARRITEIRIFFDDGTYETFGSK